MDRNVHQQLQVMGQQFPYQNDQQLTLQAMAADQAAALTRQAEQQMALTQQVAALLANPSDRIAIEEDDDGRACGSSSLNATTSSSIDVWPHRAPRNRDGGARSGSPGAVGLAFGPRTR